MDLVVYGSAGCVLVVGLWKAVQFVRDARKNGNLVASLAAEKKVFVEVLQTAKIALDAHLHGESLAQAWSDVEKSAAAQDLINEHIFKA